MTKTNTEHVLATLGTWLRATAIYGECDRGLDHAPLEAATWWLIRDLDDCIRPFCPAGTSSDNWNIIVSQVMLNVRAVADRFTSDGYGDDDTDAPRDVEWDVHSLMALVDLAHQIPVDVEPAHVVGTVFPHPSDDE